MELYTEALLAQKENSLRQDSLLACLSQRPPDQPTITDAIEATKKFSAKSLRALELNRAMTYFIAKDEQPLYTVEKPALVSKLNPRYELPGPKYFMEHQFPQLYNEIKEKIVIS